MLAKINRIKKEKDFEAVFKNSKSLRSGPFIFRIAKNNLDLSRVGFVVSQKVSKKATLRNRVKRRLADAIRGEMGNIKGGTDLVLIALPGAEKEDFLDIRKTVKEALERARLIGSSL